MKTVTGFLGTYRDTSEFCSREHKGNCDFTFSNDAKVPIKDVIRMIKHNRDLVLVVNWKPNPDANMAILEKP